MDTRMRERIHEFLQHEDNVALLRDWFLESRLAEEISSDSAFTEEEMTRRLHERFERDMEEIAQRYLEELEA